MAAVKRPDTSGTSGVSPSGSWEFSPEQERFLQNEHDKEATAGAAATSGAGASRGSWFANHKLLTALIGGAIVLAIALGAGLGVGLSSNKDDGNGSSSSSRASESKGSGSDSSDSSGTITPLAKWNLTDANTKMYGASLGNWLVLERWMDEDWFTQTAGTDVWDEWSFVETLGNDKALEALKAHWDSWVSEDELDTLQSAGFNTIRIPVGYWAFIDAAEGEPYLAKSGQTDQLQKMLGWLYKRGMYASIDMHGMPGSQNGDQSSGHNTTNVQWFTDTNQQLSMQALNATIAWIQASNYSSVVNSIGIVNEPRPAYGTFSSSEKSQNWETLKTFYTNAYEACKAAGIPAMFHHGFYTGDQTPAEYWTPFAEGKDPNYLAYEDHPYPGWFTSNNNSRSYMQDNVCEIVQGGYGFPVPMVISEWSSINGVGDEDWTRTYTNFQAAGYAWSGGSIFWSFKVMNSTNPVLALAGNLQVMYSAIDMIAQGVLGKPASGQSNVAFLSSLSGADTCGSFPTETWTNPSTAGSAYSSSRKRDSAAITSQSQPGDSLRRRSRRRLDEQDA